MAKQNAKSNDKPSHASLEHTERSTRKAAGREEIQTWEDEGGAEPDGPQQKDPNDGYEDRSVANQKMSDGEPSTSAPARNIDGDLIGHKHEEPRGRSGMSRAGAKSKAGSRNNR